MAAHPSAGPERWNVKMMKRFAFACATSGALAACAAEPEPQPDPALVERLALANAAAPEAPKLDKAEGIVKAIDRSDPDRLAAPAQALLAR
jgi:hypothetical protein